MPTSGGSFASGAVVRRRSVRACRGSAEGFVGPSPPGELVLDVQDELGDSSALGMLRRANQAMTGSQRRCLRRVHGVDICLIQVPFMAGDGAHPAAEGPGRYLHAGAERLLAGGGIRVTSRRAEVRTQVGVDAPSASRAVNRRLRPLVQAAAAEGQLPVVLAGSCDVCMGVLAGLERKRCGMVWIDAHADFNTPQSSVSGFLPGMSLAIATGHCHQRLWASIGNSTPVPEDVTVLVGVRILSPPVEAHRLRQSNIRTVPWHQGTPVGDLDAELDRLAGRVDEVYLHIDNDAFDPRTAPGVVDEPVPGGLSMSDMEHAVTAVASRFRVAAVTLATYTPHNDRDDRTLNAGLRILELLGRYAAATR